MDATLRLGLDAVIADRGRGIERFRYVRAGQWLKVLGLGRVVRPDACVAVRLEFDPNRLTLGARLTAPLVQCPLQVLDMVPVLVGKNVGFRERSALGPELGLELLEEAEIDVHVPVGRAVEGAGLA